MKVLCENCSHYFPVPEAYINKTIKCPKCKQEVIVHNSTIEEPPSTNKKTFKFLTTPVIVIISLLVGILLGIASTKPEKEEKEEIDRLQNVISALRNKIYDYDKQINLLQQKLNQATASKNYQKTAKQNNTNYVQRDYSNEDNSSTAISVAKDHIKSILKAPRTAKFPWFDNKCISHGNQIYEVFTYVDSQNSFGAMIRTKFRVKLRYNGGDKYDNRNWTVLEYNDY